LNEKKPRKTRGLLFTLTDLQKSRKNAPDFNREMNGGLLLFAGYAKI